MRHDNVRSAVTKAKFNEQNSGILFFEIAIISIAIGYIYKSWFFFGGSLLGLIICTKIKPLAVLLGFVLSLAWGIIGYFIGKYFSHDASIVLGVLAFLIGIGAHMSAFEWVSDVGKR